MILSLVAFRGVAANCPFVGEEIRFWGGGSHAEERGSFSPNVLFISILFDYRLSKIITNIIELNENKGASAFRPPKITIFAVVNIFLLKICDQG